MIGNGFFCASSRSVNRCGNSHARAVRTFAASLLCLQGERSGQSSRAIGIGGNAASERVELTFERVDTGNSR